jgi:hypothetical protein
VSANLSLAQEHLRRLGVPTTLDSSYSREDAVRMLQGRAVDPAVEDTLHTKLAWVIGAQLIGHIDKRHPALRWTPDRVAVRTLFDGEASASFLSFSDGSHVVLLSRALQENLICVANVLEYFDVSTAVARLSFRRGKRKQLMVESASRVAAILRYLLGHRMNGKAPPVPATLDQRSFDIAGNMATGAVMFVVAHEIAHIAHGHEAVRAQPNGADGETTVDELQELQADAWALNFLTELMADDPAPENMALWCAFIALFAMEMTEQAVYVRRNRTHPEAWSRWATLETLAGEPDERTRALRLALLSAFAGASKLDEPFPDQLWPLLWKDQLLSVDSAITAETLSHWDYLHTCPLEPLTVQAERSATDAGRTLMQTVARMDDVTLDWSTVQALDKREHDPP